MSGDVTLSVPFLVLEVLGTITGSLFIRANLYATAWVVALSAATITIPLWLGIRSLRNREY